MLKIITPALFLILSTKVMAASNLRSELSRYILLRDRTIVDHGLKNQVHQSFFDLQFNISSGIKKLIGDINTSTDDSNSSSAKTSNVLAVLNRNINTERYIDIGAELALPLPYMQYGNYRFLPSLFVGINLGGSLTISNKEDGLNPKAQTYLKQEMRYGLFTRMKWNDKKGESLDLALYKVETKDFLTQSTAQAIADDEKIINTDDFDKKESSYAIDLSYKRHFDDYSYLLEILDLKITQSGEKSIYGRTPLIHGRYEWNKNFLNMAVSPFLGLHYRKRYDLSDGIYLGARFEGTKQYPFSFIAKVSNQFLTFTPKIAYKYFEFSYGLKTPYRNPQEDVWVSSVHSINLRVPFP